MAEENQILMRTEERRGEKRRGEEDKVHTWGVGVASPLISQSVTLQMK